MGHQVTPIYAQKDIDSPEFKIIWKKMLYIRRKTKVGRAEIDYPSFSPFSPQTNIYNPNDKNWDFLSSLEHF